MKRTPNFSFGADSNLPAMTYLPDVLSATSYPQSARGTAPDENAEQRQLFGGLVEVPTSDDEIDTRPKKRSKSSKKTSQAQDEAAEVPKRQRGRPKVTTRDGTAAERRRTQIRLAQRAYRTRKENTITELTQKVETLQAAMRGLKQDFSTLRENLSTMGVLDANLGAAQQLNNMLQHLTDAIDSTSSDPEKVTEAEAEVEGGVEDSGPSTFADQQHRGDARQTSPGTLESQTFPADEQPSAGTQYDFFDIDTAHLGFDLNEYNLTDHQDPTVLRVNNLSLFDHRSPPVTTTDLDKLFVNQKTISKIERFPLKQEYTYSFQETTFSRRLQRFCLEDGFRKLNDPQVNPEWARQKFHFTFHFSTKARILAVIKDILSRGTGESLENYGTPFLHIGGAGLHFPRRDSQGNPVYPPNSFRPVRKDSTWRLPDVDTVSSATTLEAVLEASGFDGEWFDSHDVEEYLRSKGVYPSPQASFVIVDRALVNPMLTDASRVATTTATTITSSSSLSSRSNSTGNSPQQQQQDFEVSLTSQGAHGLLDEHQMEPRDRVHGWLSQDATFSAGGYEFDANTAITSFAPVANRLVTIEIEKFLERLAEGSVCLGRAPGFRKDLVDHALFLAVQEAF